eukprot:CAMPEP_0119139602 /NCGR_PEP_ID=MMETSP1310-20130426/27791_1 /TAXON_ID=464262 /ORGANISM="Genus nov. species nov., Strain RCC2339" /LENGTH=403 /DNA_ID=CAMNT_0007130913 /DNA_START=136 /DNA_END=1343 /DNA_ORIENTATION=+
MARSVALDTVEDCLRESRVGAERESGSWQTMAVMQVLKSAITAKPDPFEGHLSVLAKLQVRKGKCVAQRGSWSAGSDGEALAIRSEPLKIVAVGDSQSDLLAKYIVEAGDQTAQCVRKALNFGSYKSTVHMDDKAEFGTPFIQLFDKRLFPTACGSQVCGFLKGLSRTDQERFSKTKMPLLSRQTSSKLIRRWPHFERAMRAVLKTKPDLVMVMDSSTVGLDQDRNVKNLFKVAQPSLFTVEQDMDILVSDTVRMLKLYSNGDVQNVALFTTSPFTVLVDHPTLEVTFFQRAIEGFGTTEGVEKCGSTRVDCEAEVRSKGGRVMGIAILMWHKLVCPTYDGVNPCPHNTRGYKKLFPDNLHPTGESGIWFASRMLLMMDHFVFGDDATHSRGLAKCMTEMIET